MRSLLINRRSTKIVLLIASGICLLTTCMQQEEVKDDQVSLPSSDTTIARRTYFSEYTGSEKCMTCHQEIYSSFTHTSHFSSSRPASEQTIRGSFEKGKNIYRYNADLYMAMEKRDSGLFQVVYYKGKEKLAIPFDMTIGSGTKGQSFMYWHNTGLFQTPMTYYSVAGQWANSPGFPGKVQQDRPITSRCMECHTTYADVISPWSQEPEQFARNKTIFGVGCEKCHGPGAKHVDFHLGNPSVKTAKFIVNPAKLTRQQNMDLCALCHGGRKTKIQPSFSFVAGDTLSHFFAEDPTNTAIRNPGMADVHGNQSGVLMASQCYIKSNTMTCGTCHNTHENERGKSQLFASRCQTCHQEEHKPIPDAPGLSVSVLKNNCANCHMPVSESRSIVLQTSGMEAPKAALFRTHFISIYPDATRVFLKTIHKKK